jgi:adhesin/invasin
MQWSVSPSTLAGGPWLSVFPGSGQTDAASEIAPQVRVNVNPQGLNAGTYYGSVKIASTGATNDPQFVSVVLTVLPPGTNLGPIVQPAGIIFTGVVGGEAPGSQTLTIQSTSSTPLTFSARAVTGDGGNWIQPLPASGTATQIQPVRIVIQPLTQGLARGVYRGSLTIAFSDGSTRTIALLLVMIAPAAGLAEGEPRSLPKAVAACQPTVLAPVFTGVASGTTLPVGYPGAIVVKVVDDCGNPMTTGGVTTTFSNGDPPLGLSSLRNGSWAGTWTPRKASTEVIVAAAASIPDQNLKGQVQIRVGAATRDDLPIINADGIVNAASFAQQRPVAPGSLVSVFGTRLTSNQGAATTFPLPTILGGSTILIGGVQAPLIYTSDGQLNAMIPYGIPVNSTQQAIASREVSLSVPQQLIIAAAAPGVFTLDGKQAIVVDVDPGGAQTLVDQAHPATRGHALVIYCTGLGEVSPPVPTGSPAPSNPPSSVVNPVSVSIGGVPANLLFAGLTPTLAGLYQVNAILPADVTPGSQVPVVLISAGQSSTPVTIAVK